jgi:preprotein translocase subunit SecF
VTVAPSLVPEPRFRINRHRWLAWIGSGLACLLSLVGLVLCWLHPSIRSPLKPGLDFTGGTQIQVVRACDSLAASSGNNSGNNSGSGANLPCPAISAPQIQQELTRIQLKAEGSDQLPNLGSTNVQVLDKGRSVVLRLPALSPDQASAVLDDLNQRIGPLQKTGSSIDTIGPTLGSRLLQGSLISLLVSFAGIAAYISFRYSGVYAFLALVCLAHDVLITCGLFAWLGLLRGIEVDSLFAVSLITVAGYSVTDTVVVFDRIREQRKALAQLPVVDQVDVAVDATLTRSLYTSLTTLLPLLALIFFGGSSLFWFSIALAVGIGVGSWSSIGIAPTLLPLLARR